MAALDRPTQELEGELSGALVLANTPQNVGPVDARPLAALPRPCAALELGRSLERVEADRLAAKKIPERDGGARAHDRRFFPQGLGGLQRGMCVPGGELGLARADVNSIKQ